MCFNLVRKENPGKIISVRYSDPSLFLNAEQLRTYMYLSANPDPQGWNDSKYFAAQIKAVFWIRIRTFLAFPDPDPLDRDTDPASDPSIIKQNWK